MGHRRTGYDYVPSPGEEYFPAGRPSGTSTSEGDTILARGTDSSLVRNKDGDVIVTDNRGNRRSK